MPSPRIRACALLAALLACLALPGGRAEVVVNEILAAGSDRALRWSPAGAPRLGFGTPWQAPGYDDAAWLSGNGPFGFGSFANVSPAPAIGTNLATQMVNLTPTVYLRRAFTASAAQAASGTHLSLEVRYNDGFVAYLNGVEVARRNAGPPGEFKYRDSFAAFGTPANTEPHTTPYLRTETLDLGPASARLVAGENLLAIHALNYWENTNVHNASTNAYAGVNNSNNFYFRGDLRIGGTTLVANNTAWKYLPGLVEPSGGLFDPALLFAAKQNVPWGRRNFDDTEWAEGAAPLGAGPPPSGVALGTNLTSQIPGLATSLYCRIVFDATAADLADPLALQLLMDWDDGFVAYLNGVEVARDRMDLAHSFVPHTAVASSARAPGGYATYNLDPPARILAEGPNVLAVQVHNVSLHDADLFMRAQLRTHPSGGNRLIVPATATWRHFVGVSEPQGAEDSESEVEIDGPESSPDWIELRNAGTAPVSLAGWRLSDNPSNPGKWTFPPGTEIPAGGYLLVLCDGLDIADPAPGGYLHANFRLSGKGESVVLSNAAGELVDSVTFGPQTPFESYGRDGSGQWAYLAEPTPGAPNSGPALGGRVEPVQFDQPPGFHPGALVVGLSCATPGATIRYTLDGSEPTETHGTVGGSAAIPASRALRARAFAPGMIPSETATGTYLVNEPAARQSVPALCFVADQERSLYRPYGVMAISGGSWTNVASPGPTSLNGVWTQTGSAVGGAADLSAYNNPIHRGRFIERPVNLEILRADGTPGPNVLFGLRVAGSPHARPRYVLANQNRAPGAVPGPNDGAWSQTAFVQKPSFNLFFRGDYSGDLSWPLFEGSAAEDFHSLRLRAGKNDVSNPFLIDEFMRRLFVSTGQVGSRGIINTLYVNGVYKGYYNLCEHLREKNFQYHYRSDKPWDVRQVTTIASGDGLAFQEMITYLRTHPQGTLAHYEGMSRRLDMVNFVDYLLANIVGNTGDWPHNNFVCSRERSPEGIHRYHLWDAEGAFGSFGANVRTNMFQTGTTGSIVTNNPNTDGLNVGIRILYTLLRQSPEFRLLFADRIQRHFFNDGVFTEARMLADWEAMKAEFAPLIAPANINDRVTPWFNGAGNTSRYTTSGATNTPSRRVVLFEGYHDDTAGGAFVPAQLVAEGLWPATLAPGLSHPGGSVAPGFALALSNPNGGGAIHYTLDGSDPRAPGGGVHGPAYAGPLVLHFSTTVKARVLSAGGEWSPLQEAAYEVARSTVHAWDFESAAAYLQPSHTYGGASLALAPGASTTAERSAAAQDFATAHLRINNPLGATLRLDLPTTGFEHVGLEYRTRRSGQGAGLQSLDYSLDGGDTWAPLETYAVLDAAPQTRRYALSHLPAAWNNPLFAVRLTFAQGDGGTAGNHRFDEIALTGVPIPGHNFAPYATPALPVRLDAIEGGAALDLPLADWFQDPEDEPLAFTAASSLPAYASASVVAGRLLVAGLRRGECVVTLTASDGAPPPTETSVRVLVHPRPHLLSGGSYGFAEWSEDSPDHSYPPHLLFLQGAEADPPLAAPLDRAYRIPAADAAAPGDADFPYRATARSRINGLGGNGVAFLNTGRARDLGGALLALDTTGLADARVAFTAGTVTANTRVYAIRLQYRIGVDGPFADLPGPGGAPVEYLRSGSGHNASIGPVDLPPALLDRPYVQLLWRYRHVSGTSGARAQLRLDDISVATDSGAVPDRIEFASAPASVQSGAPLGPVVVRVLDADGVPIAGYEGAVTIGLSGPGSLGGTLTVNAVNGIATFADLVYHGSGSLALSASADGLESVFSPPLRSLALVELDLPRHIQGGTDGDGANAERVPYAWRARIEGLEPHATYRYANRAVLDTDGPQNDGAGNMIFAPEAAGPWVRSTQSPRFLGGDLGVRHHQFVAGADGTHTAWFLTEPTGNARFTPGNTLRLRLLLNDGEGGEVAFHYLTTAAGAEVRRFGPAPGEATGVAGETSAPARALVLLHDDIEGLGRPLAATPVEITGAEVDDRYAPFYRHLAAAVPGRWGSLLPNALPAGLRRIEVRDFATHELLELRTAPGGFPGTADPDGGLDALLLDPGLDAPVFLPVGNGSWHLPANWSSGAVPDAAGAGAIINGTAANRNLTLAADATLGFLRFSQGNSAFRNRLAGSGGAKLVIDGGGGSPAVLRVDGDPGATGFAELEIPGGGRLDSDLVLLVDHPDGSPEFGALRLREGWTGLGGLVKRGVGMATFTGGGKDFTGPLRVERGVARVTSPSVPGASSGVSVEVGGQLRLVSTGTAAAPSPHAFGGGPIRLAGPGRDGVGGGAGLGVRGALRYEPGGDGGHHASLANDLLLEADADLHVGGGSNRLLLQGGVSGDHLLVKSGGGALVIAGESAAPASPIQVENGLVAIDGVHPAPVEIAAGARLGGAGQVGAISGAGSVDPGVASLSATRSAAARLAFTLAAAGGGLPPGNGALVLSDPAPFAAVPETLDLYLDHSGLEVGDRFRGGPVVAPGVELAAALDGAELRVFVADPDGGIQREGKAYRPAAPADQLALSVVPVPGGSALEVLRVGVPATYGQWRKLHFPEPGEHGDETLSGPAADPSGGGLPNLLRHALGLAPTDAALRPGLADGGAGAGRVFRFPFAPAAPGIRWRVVASTDLQDWSLVLYDSATDPDPATADGVASVALPDGARLFVRLELVEEAP